MTDYRSIVRAPLLIPNPLRVYRPVESRRQTINENLLLISDGGTGPDFNWALVFGPVTAAQLADAAGDFFDDTGYAIIVESDAAPGLEEELRASGWEVDQEEPAMVLAPIPRHAPPPAELEIRMVTTEPAYEDYMTLVPGNRAWVPSLEAATAPRVAIFVGYLGGTPVATARLTCFDTIGELNAITTVEAQRRRGFGTAMTWAAIDEAERRGCTAITLSASPMGYPVYLRMGFTPVCSYCVYVQPDRLPG